MQFLFLIGRFLKTFSETPLGQMNRNLVGCIYGDLLTDQNDISNCNRGLSIDASYQVSVHLAKQFHIIWPSGFRGKAVLEIDQ
jgi:hypothetical protein